MVCFSMKSKTSSSERQPFILCTDVFDRELAVNDDTVSWHMSPVPCCVLWPDFSIFSLGCSYELINSLLPGQDDPPHQTDQLQPTLCFSNTVVVFLHLCKRRRGDDVSGCVRRGVCGVEMQTVQWWCEVPICPPDLALAQTAGAPLLWLMEPEWSWENTTPHSAPCLGSSVGQWRDGAPPVALNYSGRARKTAEAVI